MDDNVELLFSIITKLMNEENNNRESLSFSNILYQELLKILDEGSYIDNARILKRIARRLEVFQATKLIPELLMGKICGFMGDSEDIYKYLEFFIPNLEIIQKNTNIPLLLIPHDSDDLEFVAINYCDNKIRLLQEEYFLITQKLYKHKIDVRNLVKLLIIYYPKSISINMFLLVPTYVDKQNKFLRSLFIQVI